MPTACTAWRQLRPELLARAAWVVLLVFVASTCGQRPSKVERGINELKHPKPLIRVVGVSYLEGSKDPRGIDALVEALKHDEDARVRAAAARVLGTTASGAALFPLFAGLKDANGEVRATAAYALGQLKDIRAVGPLVEALSDSDLEVRGRVVGALLDLCTDPFPAEVRDAIQTHALDAVAARWEHILNDHMPAAAALLVAALEHHGTKEMAERMLTSNYRVLNTPGEMWLGQHGYVITRMRLKW